ncbi:hypothetical protein M9H77_08986 [Catharanthus roseus]|uniref:Uncharacterized protein n=1 Tax=Catharanthus roseus TaxID=4058 RepID=A0ACC0BZH9_CATRO|nr:hypothetical protein M9H77_08986 [Catharanthus roseus]
MDTVDDHRHFYKRSASRITIFAHIFGILSLILMLVWLLHYRGGLNLDSASSSRVFNVHPFLMFFGFIFFAGEAMMAYKTVLADHDTQKFVHFFFHLVAITLGIVGIHATFKFHDKARLKHMYSLHSWIGMATFCLYILQWLFGMALYLFPRPMGTRARFVPWHITGGRALLYMAICAAETGLMEKVTFLDIHYNREARLVNFLGLSILLFGLTVDISVALARHV